MPTRYPGTAAETAALDAYIKLMRAAESLTVRVGDVMREAGLSEEAQAALRTFDRDRLVKAGAHPYLVFMAGLRVRMAREPAAFERF